MNAAANHTTAPAAAGRPIDARRLQASRFAPAAALHSQLVSCSVRRLAAAGGRPPSGGGECRHPARRRFAATRASAATQQAAAATGASSSNQLPRSPAAMVDQAAAAVQAGLDAGRVRQQLTFLLPINEKEVNFNSTEPLDYPCSLQKEFDTACALVKSLMQRLLGASTPILAKRLDSGGVEGEPCAVMYPEDKSFLAVVFPTADCLKQLQAFAKEAGRPLLIVNAQWNNSGQVISDFGFGPWRKAADDFLGTFEPAFLLKEKRIGSPGTIAAATGARFKSGGVVRMLRQYPGQYQCYALAPDGSSQLMSAVADEPSYQDLDAMIKAGRQAKLEIFEIAQRAPPPPSEQERYDGYEEQEEETLEGQGTGAAAAAQQPGGSAAASPAAASSAATASSSGPGGEEAAELGGLSDADIEAMDAATLRRLLLAAGQPASGKMSKLRERLREVRDGA